MGKGAMGKKGKKGKREKRAKAPSNRMPFRVWILLHWYTPCVTTRGKKSMVVAQRQCLVFFSSHSQGHPYVLIFITACRCLFLPSSCLCMSWRKIWHQTTQEANIWKLAGMPTFVNSYFNLIAIFVGPESDHCLLLSLTDWLTHLNDELTHSCLVNLIDVTLACEDANSKLVDVTVADEDCVGNNLLQICKLRFGQKARRLFRLWAQGFVKILKLKFRQDLKLEVVQFFSTDVL